MSENLLNKSFVEDFAEDMRKYYIDLPFHNFDGHVMNSVNYFNHLTEVLGRQDVDIDRNLGHLALYAHDANYHKDHIAVGHSYKEEYSAEIAKNELANRGMNSSVIDKVSQAILSTRYDITPESNLDKAVRIADVGNVMGNETEFLKNFGLIIQEAVERKVPIEYSFREYCQQVEELLSCYINPPPVFINNSGEEITLQENMSFARRNITSLSRLTVGKLVKVTGVVLPDSFKAS